MGYYYSYIDHDRHSVYFLKRFLTFRREFVNPYASESDHLAVQDMPQFERSYLQDYCKYRFGVTDFSTESLEKCGAQAMKEEE